MTEEFFRNHETCRIGPRRVSTTTLKEKLLSKNHRLVLAESCTAGMAAAMLGGVPGISECFCGSMVVYRNASKRQWLGLEDELLEDPNRGPVSFETTELLAKRILVNTPEATLAAAVTGHLGPNAPEHLDGVGFVATLERSSMELRSFSFLLDARSTNELLHQGMDARVARQTLASHWVLQAIDEAIDSPF